MIGYQLQTKFLSYRRQHEDDFHHRKRSADARSWSTTKRKVRVLWKSNFKLFCPAFRFEIAWFIIKASIAVRDPLKHEHLRSGRDPIAANLTIIDRFTAQSIRGRIETHRFL